MNLSKTWKIVVGLATGFYALAPMLMVVLWFGFIITIIIQTEASPYGEPSPLVMLPFFLIFPIILLFNLLHLALVSFYIIHVIKNNAGHELARILLGVGLFFMPMLIMPVYFFIYIWPSELPTWALARPPADPVIAAPPAAQDLASPIKNKDSEL